MRIETRIGDLPNGGNSPAKAILNIADPPYAYFVQLTVQLDITPARCVCLLTSCVYSDVSKWLSSTT